ncbi:MAG: TIGR04211 family SH3 domain-containing protein [Pseudomonadota bacterium]
MAERSSPVDTGVRQLPRLLVTALLLLLAGQPALAETTQWVRDVLYVTLRDGPGSQHPVIATLQTGDAVEILEEGDEGNYARVRTDNDLEGWIQQQYLTDERIAAHQLEEAERAAEQAISQRDEARSELETVTRERDELAERAATLEEERDTLTSELTELQEIAEQPAELAEQNEEMREEVAAMEDEVESMRREMQALESSERRDWFLIGGGVLLAGLILGLILPHLRGGRRSSWEI